MSLVIQTHCIVQQIHDGDHIPYALQSVDVLTHNCVEVVFMKEYIRVNKVRIARKYTSELIN